MGPADLHRKVTAELKMLTSPLIGVLERASATCAHHLSDLRARDRVDHRRAQKT